MQVSLSVDALSPNLTGIGRYCWELCQGIGSDARVARVRYFVGRSWLKDPTSVLQAGFIPQRRGRWRIGLDQWWHHRRLATSVVHAPNYFLPDWAEQGVATVHDLSVFKYPETHPVERIKAFEAGFAATMRRAAMILTDCEWVRREVIEYTGISANRVKAVPLGVGREFHPRPAADLAAFAALHGLPIGRYGLSVSTLEPRKRIGHLISAWSVLPASLRKRHPLVIAGPLGWQNEKLLTQIDSARAHGWLHYLGPISEAELPLLYAGARVFAYPSQYEGFGLPPLEALASGVPTIVARGTCLEEIVGPAVAMVDPEDILEFSAMIERLLNDEPERTRLSSVGIVHATQYTWKQCIARTVDAYQTLLQEQI